MRYRATLMLSIVTLGLTGCFSSVGKRKLVLPPAASAVAKAWPEPQMEPPPDIELPINFIGEVVTLPENPKMENPPPDTTPVKPPPRPRKPVTATAPVVPPEVETTPPTTPTTPVGPPLPPPAPQLGEILTEDRRRQYEGEFADSVSRAKTAVTHAAGRRLTGRQKETVQRIRTFLSQAEESKVKDLVSACSLAHRADLLAQDLMKTLP